MLFPLPIILKFKLCDTKLLLIFKALFLSDSELFFFQLQAIYLITQKMTPSLYF